MTDYTPTFENGKKFVNEHTEERYVILDVRYNKDKADIEYKLQKCRLRFDMFWITESTIEKNLQLNKYQYTE